MKEKTLIFLFLIVSPILIEINAQVIWEKVNGPNSGFISSVICSQQNYIFAGTYGYSYTGFGYARGAKTIYGQGLYRSTDNGKTWVKTNFLYENILALAVSPKGNIFVHAQNNSAGYSYGGNFKLSVDGDTATHLDIENAMVFSFAFNSRSEVFAGTRDDGIYLSIDDGKNWVNLSDSLKNITINTIYIDINDDIYLGTTDGVYKSSNNGNS